MSVAELCSASPTLHAETHYDLRLLEPACGQNEVSSASTVCRVPQLDIRFPKAARANINSKLVLIIPKLVLASPEVVPSQFITIHHDNASKESK
jgi:hypothetical protein